MDKSAIKQLTALVGTMAALFLSARTSWANTLDASYTSGDPIYIDYNGCGVARYDNIKICVSTTTLSDCESCGTEISDQTAGLSEMGHCNAYGGTYNIGCPTYPYPSYWICAEDTTTSVWAYKSLGTAPECTQRPAATQSQQDAMVEVPWVRQPLMVPSPMEYGRSVGSDRVILSFAGPQFVPWVSSMNTK